MVNNINANSEIARLFEMLHSPSDAERELAKRQIIEFGSDAVAPLIDFLRFLAATNRIPRFQTGQEQQGQAAVDDYNLLLQREGDESPNLYPAMERVFNLVINDRLSNDVIFSLGKIKSEEAIQFLIKIMRFNGRYFTLGEEINALQAAGLDAVPYLINEIREIDSKIPCYPTEELQFRFVISGTIPKEDELELDELGLEDAETEPTESWDPIYAQILHHAILLMIFGRMRDPRTVPYLEELIKEMADERLISIIKATIATIKAPALALPSEYTPSPGHVGYLVVRTSHPRKD